MRRIVCVWLPDWPITVWRRARQTLKTTTRAGSPDRAGVPDADQPFALVDRTGRGVTLHAVNEAARQRFRLRRGQSHADARAIAPDLISASAEPDEEVRALQALALWFERFSPTVAVVTNTRSFQTIGDDQPSPGMDAFQRTFELAVQASGTSFSDEMPWRVGPRNWGQFSARSQPPAANATVNDRK